MLELLFVLGFFIMLLVTGVSLVGVFVALLVAVGVMFFGGLLVLMLKMLPWLLLAIVAVWVIRAINNGNNTQSRSHYRRDMR
ncbi:MULTISPECIES: envelope stress response protein PspG [Mangrovibacter]|uniref:Phage shock protein G n=2 Tax=Mangrovibacter TaxID=451512 RepID=A0A1B7L5H9_9ENTR|nr:MULTISPECIES: envelope stress response protein PspG [Mangrovibacter]KEA49970.1 phage shock protein [Mangrovibacter sp. MFB070]OAT77535.1 phage shock protein G [Mangrovibacter phragmitis]PWW06942.1 phage shock protein G [Mangrovibacter plantisponsor]